MDENKNMGQVADMASAPALKKSAGKSERKNDCSKDAQVIRSFLESVGMYEGDALRVSIAIADGKTSCDDMPHDDRIAVNRYLNYGLHNSQRSTEMIQAHRVSRSFLLMKRVADYVDKQQAILLGQSLFTIAVCKKDIEEVYNNFDKRPGANAVTSVNANVNTTAKL